jgi:hypothetical protein
MQPLQISKRHLSGLVTAASLFTLTIGWFIGVYYFDGSNLNQSARSKADRDWLNIMVGEYDPSQLQSRFFAASQAQLGGDVSTIEYGGVDGGMTYTNIRQAFSVKLPPRVLLTRDIIGNPGIQLVVHEASPTEFFLSEAARQLEPQELVGSADKSILPTFVETNLKTILASGLRVEITKVAENTLTTEIANRFPNCQVSGVKLSEVEGRQGQLVEPTYIAGEGCNLTYQPFIRYYSQSSNLVVGYTGTGCRFFGPAKGDEIVDVCLDTTILETLTFSK